MTTTMNDEIRTSSREFRVLITCEIMWLLPLTLFMWWITLTIYVYWFILLSLNLKKSWLWLCWLEWEFCPPPMGSVYLNIWTLFWKWRLAAGNMAQGAGSYILKTKANSNFSRSYSYYSELSALATVPAACCHIVPTRIDCFLGHVMVLTHQKTN